METSAIALCNLKWATGYMKVHKFLLNLAVLNTPSTFFEASTGD